MNNFCVTGNLGRDCVVRDAGGTKVANFSVAAKAGFGDKEQTIWLDCALFGKRAETRLVDYLTKGQQVAVSGELGTREHDGKTYLTLRVADVTLIGKREDASAPAPSQAAPAQPAAVDAGADFDDDIPF